MSIGDLEYRNKPDITLIWLKHMDRVNLTSGNQDGVYEAYVRQHFRLLPEDMRIWVMEQQDMFTEKKKILEFKSSGIGTDLGYEDNPLVWNDSHTELGLSNTSGFTVKRNEDGTVDWADPRIYSPKLIEEDDVDYEALNLLILAAAEKAGLTWNIKPHTYDLGDVTDDMRKNKKKLSQHPIRKTSSGRKYSDTPPGSNMNVISTMPGTNLNIIDWHGTQVIQGIGYSPIFFDLIQERTNKENGTIIGAGGGPGEGKTYFGMRLAEILNRIQPGRSFNPYVQMPFTQEHFLWLLSEGTPLTLGDVIILDEAQFAAGARNWFKEDQKELVELIASARNMGFIVILIVLHIDMLDKILRQFTMAFYIHLEGPGHATVYKTFTPRFNNEMMKNTIGPVTLQLPGIGRCEHPKCLHCNHLNPKSPKITLCLVSRAIYERRKRHFQSMKVEASLERREKLAKKKPNKIKRIEAFEKHKTTVEFTNQGRVKPEWINRVLAEEYDGYTVSIPTARSYGVEWQDHQKSTN